MFLDQPSAIFEHSSDGSTLSIHLCPKHKYFLTISLSSLSIWSAEDSMRPFISKYSMSHDEKDKFGLYNQGIWINSQIFSILTLNGNIIFYQIFNQATEIRMISSTSTDGHFIFTSISTFANFLFAGTNTGEIVIIAPNSQTFIHHKVIEEPIRSISISGNRGVLLAANRLVFSFTMNKSVLTEQNYDIGLKQIDTKCATSISLSPNHNYAAALDPSGFIYVTDFANYSNKFKIQNQMTAVFLWSQDGSTLFAIFRDGTVVILSMIQRVPRRVKIPELEGCVAASIGRYHIFASSNAGLVNIPILTASRNGYPLVFGPNALYAFRSIDRKAASVNFVLPTSISQSIKQIEYAAADNIERMIAFSGKGQIYLLDQVLGKWISCDAKVSCRGLCWCDRYLCCLSFNSETLQYSLNVFEIHMHEHLSLVYSYSLPSRPFSISADDKIICVCLANKLLIFHELHYIGAVSMVSQPYMAQPHYQTKDLFVLTQDRKLLNLNLSSFEFSTVLEDCGDFIVDSGFGIIFTQVGLRIKLSSTKTIKFGPFTETSDIIIGVFPRCTSLLLLQSTATPPFNPVLSQFFDLSIVRELKDPQTAALMFKQRIPLGHMFKIFLRQIAVFSLRDRLGKLLVPFLEYFPEDKNMALSSALRAVESPERQGVIEAMGPVSTIFAMMANLDIKNNNIVTFVEKDDNIGDINNAALLLPVIMEEEGPLVGFPAAIYVLTKLHENIDFVGSLVRFLDPLISGGKQLENGMVDCVGMKLTVDQYTELYRRMALAFEFCLLDLMKNYKPQFAVPFIATTRIDAVDVFKKNIEVDDQFDLPVVLDNIGPLITNHEFSRDDATRLLALTADGGWMGWSCALFLVTGRNSDAITILNNNKKLKMQIMSSQWKHLVDM